MKLPTRIFQDPPPTIFPGRKNPALSSKLSSGTFPETPSPTNILTTQTWLVPEGSGLEDFPGMVSWEIPGRGHLRRGKSQVPLRKQEREDDLVTITRRPQTRWLAYAQSHLLLSFGARPEQSMRQERTRSPVEGKSLGFLV